VSFLLIVGYFYVVVGLAWSNDPESYAGLANDKVSHAGQVTVMTQTTRNTVDLQGGLVRGTDNPIKKYVLLRSFRNWKPGEQF